MKKFWNKHKSKIKMAGKIGLGILGVGIVYCLGKRAGDKHVMDVAYSFNEMENEYEYGDMGPVDFYALVDQKDRDKVLQVKDSIFETLHGVELKGRINTNYKRYDS